MLPGNKGRNGHATHRKLQIGFGFWGKGMGSTNKATECEVITYVNTNMTN